MAEERREVLDLGKLKDTGYWKEFTRYVDEILESDTEP